MYLQIIEYVFYTICNHSKNNKRYERGVEMQSRYMELKVDKIELDFDNPRIAKYVEQYGKNQITSEALSLALGRGSDDKSGTSYSSLKESIKSNGGIIHPIIVNKNIDDKYVVIEGNTRVQIYKEFFQNNVPGEWNENRAIVYENLDEREIIPVH